MFSSSGTRVEPTACSSPSKLEASPVRQEGLVLIKELLLDLDRAKADLCLCAAKITY